MEGFQRFLEVCRGFLGFSEIFQRFFGGPFRDPLRGRFPSQRLSVLLPLIVLPVELSPSSGPLHSKNLAFCVCVLKPLS